MPLRVSVRRSGTKRRHVPGIVDENVDRPEFLAGALNDHDPDDLSRLDKVIAKLAAAGYHEPSTRDARNRIIAFFRAPLVDAPAKA